MTMMTMVNKLTIKEVDDKDCLAAFAWMLGRKTSIKNG